MSPAATARILHLALMASVILTSVILALVPISPSPMPPLFLYAVFGVAAVLFAGALVISSRLPPQAGSNADAWWSQNLPRAIMIWAMLEGPSVLGAVAYLLTRNVTALVVPLIGVLLFLILSPSRLEQG